MSSYIEKKVLRIPFDKIVKDEGISHWDFLENLEDTQPEICKSGNVKGFDIEMTSGDIYLDWVYYYDSDGSDDFGYANTLSDSEKEVAKTIFDKLGYSYDIEDVHKVHYCYYNCSEPDDIYDVDICDDSDEFL